MIPPPTAAEANSIARNRSPLPRKTVAKKRSSSSPRRSRSTPMNHKKAMPANGTRFSARATLFELVLSHAPVSSGSARIVQRKVLTPNDFSSLQELEERLLAFQSHYERSASPFNWTFTRRDLNTLLAKIAVKHLAPAA